MAYQLSGKLVADAFDSGRLPHPTGLVAMKVEHIGDLVVTSQEVIAEDPCVPAGSVPFTQKVPNGKHPVSVAIADFAGDERIAFARVQFSMREAVAWKMAVTNPHRDFATLGEDRFSGYGVDSGTGCFMDLDAAKLIGRRYQEEGPYFAFGDLVIEEMEKTYRDTRSWGVVYPVEGLEGNVICFSSGYGDGAYPSFFGLDADGAVAQLVTDFMLFAGQGE